ncbi:hypothetical protein H5410_001170 [Solanum commersonii]|uniref:Uncharacterized protein n=1 Tax=Solanum commersonii TaxID=4109 RepID=A0A9J6AXX2_SOLCO|nr:hypothetical protein H5410_001170 [Solanum commersonii]
MTPKIRGDIVKKTVSKPSKTRKERLEKKTDSGDESSSRDNRDTGKEDDDPLSLPTCARVISGKSYNLTTCMDELGSFPAKISVRARMTLYRNFRNALWGKECFDLTVKYLKNKINLKKQSEVYKEKGNASFGYTRLFLILVIMQRSPWILLCQFPVYLDGTRQRAITLSKVMHPYLVPTVRETKQNYMATLKPYMDEVKDTIIDALKANLKGVIVLISAVENHEDEILSENNSNQPCENSVLSGQKNKDDNLCKHEKLRRAQKNKKNEDYTTPIINEDGADEKLPLAIIDEDLVPIDEYFAEEVNEQEEEKMAEKDEEREEEKLEENKEEIEEKLEEKKQEEEEEEHIEENEEEDEEEEQIEL